MSRRWLKIITRPLHMPRSLGGESCLRRSRTAHYAGNHHFLHFGIVQNLRHPILTTTLQPHRTVKKLLKLVICTVREYGHAAPSCRPLGGLDQCSLLGLLDAPLNSTSQRGQASDDIGPHDAINPVLKCIEPSQQTGEFRAGRLTTCCPINQQNINALSNLRCNMRGRPSAHQCNLILLALSLAILTCWQPQGHHDGKKRPNRRKSLPVNRAHPFPRGQDERQRGSHCDYRGRLWPFRILHSFSRDTRAAAQRSYPTPIGVSA